MLTKILLCTIMKFQEYISKCVVFQFESNAKMQPHLCHYSLCYFLLKIRLYSRIQLEKYDQQLVIKNQSLLALTQVVVWFIQASTPTLVFVFTTLLDCTKILFRWIKIVHQFTIVVGNGGRCNKWRCQLLWSKRTQITELFFLNLIICS